MKKMPDVIVSCIECPFIFWISDNEASCGFGGCRGMGVPVDDYIDNSIPGFCPLEDVDDDEA